MSHCPGLSEDDKTQFQDLNPELITYILKMTGDARTMLDARLVSSLVCDAASRAIDTLFLIEGNIPSEMWELFSEASRLVCSGAHGAEAFLQNILCLLPSLPERLSGLQLGSISAWVLEKPERYDVSAPQAQAISKLKHLSSITAESSRWPAESWAVLASLPSLSDITLSNVSIGAAAPAAPAVTRITCDSLELEHSDAELPGCLARKLPGLKELHSTFTPARSMQRVLAALRGHTALEKLSLWSCPSDELPLPWQQHLGTLVALQWLLLDCVVPADMVLADVASCSKLTSLHLRDLTEVDITPAGMAALAAGPCADSLVECKLDEFSFESGQQLLRAQLPQLCKVELTDMMRGVPRAVAATVEAYECRQRRVVEEHYLPAAAAAAGWKVATGEVHSADHLYWYVYTGTVRVEVTLARGLPISGQASALPEPAQEPAPGSVCNTDSEDEQEDDRLITLLHQATESSLSYHDMVERMSSAYTQYAAEQGVPEASVLPEPAPSSVCNTDTAPQQAAAPATTAAPAASADAPAAATSAANAPAAEAEHATPQQAAQQALDQYCPSAEVKAELKQLMLLAQADFPDLSGQALAQLLASGFRQIAAEGELQQEAAGGEGAAATAAPGGAN